MFTSHINSYASVNVLCWATGAAEHIFKGLRGHVEVIK